MVHTDPPLWQTAPAPSDNYWQQRFDQSQSIVTRLKAELEAAKRETAEARDKALEEAAQEFDKRAAVLRSARQPHDGVSWEMAACEAEHDANRIRALKSNHESKDTQGGT